MSYVNVDLRHISQATVLLNGENPPPLEECCPVALALQEATGETWLVSNYGCWIRRKANPRRSYLLSMRVARWVRQYDNGLDVQPFRFQFDTDLLPQGEYLG